MGVEIFSKWSSASNFLISTTLLVNKSGKSLNNSFYLSEEFAISFACTDFKLWGKIPNSETHSLPNINRKLSFFITYNLIVLVLSP